MGKLAGLAGEGVPAGGDEEEGEREAEGGRSGFGGGHGGGGEVRWMGTRQGEVRRTDRGGAGARKRDVDRADEFELWKQLQVWDWSLEF